MKDRTGETIDDADPTAAHTCRDGWLSPPDADVAVPCRICRPQLYGRERTAAV